MRIYNPQNQLGQNLATELSLNNAKELILRGMGLTEENISAETFKSLKTLIDTNAAQIETLQSSKLGFAFVDDLPQTGQQENIIYLVKHDASESTSKENLYTEYIAVFKTEGGSKSFDRWEEIGEVGLDLAGITDKIAATTGNLESLNTTTKDTLVAAINEVNTPAKSAVQNVTTTENGAGSNGLKLTFEKGTGNVIQTTLEVTPATLSDKKVLSGEGFATGTQVQDAITQAISDADGVVNAKSIAMSGSDSAEESKKHVTVAITGNIGEHTLAVTTKDIASAALLGTAADTKDDATAFGKIAAEKVARENAISDLSDTEDTATATSSDNFVTVSLTGTVGNHDLTVTTNDIAKASKEVSSTSTDTHVTVTLDGTVAEPKVTVTTADIASAALLGTAADTADVTTTAFGKIAAANAAITAEAQRAAGVEGTLASLNTDDKSSLVAAINEVDAHADYVTDKLGALPEDTTVVAFASAKAETAKKAAIGSSVANITDTKTSTTDVIRVTATKTAGDTSEGTGATVALAAEFTKASLTDGVLDGEGLASGAQVQSAIAKAVKDIADGQTVSIGQVLVSSELIPDNGVITVTPKEGVDAIRILDVQASNGIVWVGEINNDDKQVTLWGTEVPEDVATLKFTVSYAVVSLTD